MGGLISKLTLLTLFAYVRGTDYRAGRSIFQASLVRF